MLCAEDYNLQDFYTFVGSNNKNKNVETDTESFESDLLEDTRKPKHTSSKNITTDQGSDFNDEYPKLFRKQKRKDLKCYICSKSFATK